MLIDSQRNLFSSRFNLFLCNAKFANYRIVRIVVHQTFPQTWSSLIFGKFLHFLLRHTSSGRMFLLLFLSLGHQGFKNYVSRLRPELHLLWKWIFGQAYTWSVQGSNGVFQNSAWQLAKGIAKGKYRRRNLLLQGKIIHLEVRRG